MVTKKDFVILVDLDDVIDDLLPAWVDVLNELFNTSVDYRTITDWHMQKAFPFATDEQIYESLKEVELWKKIKPVYGAQEYLQKLEQDGFTVKICTASAPECYAMKYEYFLKKYFAFISWKDIIAAHDKQLIKGNILLDDNINNLLGGDYQGILFTRSYNEQYDADKYGLIRVYSWAEFYKHVQRLYSIFENVNKKEKI